MRTSKNARAAGGRSTAANTHGWKMRLRLRAVMRVVACFCATRARNTNTTSTRVRACRGRWARTDATSAGVGGFDFATHAITSVGGIIGRGMLRRYSFSSAATVWGLSSGSKQTVSPWLYIFLYSSIWRMWPDTRNMPSSSSAFDVIRNSIISVTITGTVTPSLSHMLSRGSQKTRFFMYTAMWSVTRSRMPWYCSSDPRMKQNWSGCECSVRE
mmetsp:Transcript_19863/g.50446  ORF Transcript_19863/g.50446 Transcript_19863/m.50446 type:complete len:214 (-) Transcript_19863:220-861(-)